MTPDLKNYPLIERFATKMDERDKYEALERDDQILRILSILDQPRMNSCVLRGLPGTGKTQIIETLAKRESDDFTVFEIDLDIMGNEGNNVFGDRIQGLVKEVIQYDQESDKNVVIFIDEFHKIGKPGYEAGLEAFKPPLARGSIRLIGATTDEEYVKYIEQDEALKERLDVVPIEELPDHVVEQILTDMWKKEVPKEPVNHDLIKKIVQYGEFLPSEANPRKSIKFLNRMIGIYRRQNVALNEPLLDQVVSDVTGIDTKFRPDLDNLEANLKKDVIGQEHAISTIINSLYRAVAGFNASDAPMGSFMFLGPTGVGKTELAKSIAKHLMGDEKRMLRYDMSEFQGEKASEKFLTVAADDIGRHPYSVVLCDEVEKAHKGVMDLFLQIISDGRLSNRYGRQVTYKKAYIIFTTNVGHESFEKARDTGEDLSQKPRRVSDILQRKGTGFRPELVNRMTALIPFNPLSAASRDAIVKKKLIEFKREMKNEGILFQPTKRVRKFLYKEGVSESTSAGGGRDINRRIADHLLVTVAKLVVKYMYDDERDIKRIKLDVLGNLVEEKQHEKTSTARLGVIEYDVLSKNGTVIHYKGQNHKKPEYAYDALDSKADINYSSMENLENTELVQTL